MPFQIPLKKPSISLNLTPQSAAGGAVDAFFGTGYPLRPALFIFEF
jgi:hypothetical protein